MLRLSTGGVQGIPDIFRMGQTLDNILNSQFFGPDSINPVLPV